MNIDKIDTLLSLNIHKIILGTLKSDGIET